MLGVGSCPGKENDVKEVIELLQGRIARAKVSADNENYLINLSIAEAERMAALLKEQPPASELKFDKYNVYLMNSTLCLPIGDFKAKIVIMCPNADTMNRMENYLKKCERSKKRLDD
jgi:hypothetical protein